MVEHNRGAWEQHEASTVLAVLGWAEVHQYQMVAAPANMCTPRDCEGAKRPARQRRRPCANYVMWTSTPGTVMIGHGTTLVAHQPWSLPCPLSDSVRPKSEAVRMATSSHICCACISATNEASAESTRRRRSFVVVPSLCVSKPPLLTW